MRQKLLYYFPVVILGILLAQGCYKDKGNYTYNIPPHPVLTLDTLYSAILGDSLIIDPKASIPGNPKIAYEWKISVPSDVPGKDVIDSSGVLRIRFTLDAQRYGG